MGRAIDMENDIQKLKVRVSILEQILEDLNKPEPKPKAKKVKVDTKPVTTTK